MSALDNPTIRLLVASGVLSVIIPTLGYWSYHSITSEIFRVAPLILIPHHVWLGHRLHKEQLSHIVQPHTLIILILLVLYGIASIITLINLVDAPWSSHRWIGDYLVRLVLRTLAAVAEVGTLWLLLVGARARDGSAIVEGAGNENSHVGYGSV
jgi:hypothetical protein